MKSVQDPQLATTVVTAPTTEEPSSLSSNSDYAYRPLTTKHRRAGSTGTTGDEEYTTDEDDALYGDETDCGSVAHFVASAHPIPKSDLARAATDLFGYADTAKDEPTSLFEDDDAENHLKSIAKPGALSIFAYASEVQPRATPATRRQLSATEKTTTTTSTTKPQGPDQQLPESSSDWEEAEKSSSSSSSSSSSESPPPPAENLPAQTDREEVAMAPSINNVHEEESDEEDRRHAFAKLQEELLNAHEKLKLKDEEVSRLSRIRQDVETELEELTASLFQEAHNMVREANQQKANAERLLEESRMKAEVLAAEVAALKTLVLTSTPAQPNPHLHPQIACNGGAGGSADDHHHHNGGGGGIFAKKHRRSPSHFNLKYGRENSPPDSPSKEPRTSLPCENCTANGCTDKDVLSDRERERDREKKRERYLLTHLICTEREREKENRDLGLEVDPRVHAEFLQWKAHPCMDKGDPFVGRIFREDIDLCLDFPNAELGARVRQAVLDGIIFVEAVSDKTKLTFPKKCALLEAPRQCHYRMRMGDQENQWHCISQICRNRIIAVCDFLNYLRYIERGLVKSSVHDVYWEITRLRKEMVLARLGLALTTV